MPLGLYFSVLLVRIGLRVIGVILISKRGKDYLLDSLYYGINSLLFVVKNVLKLVSIFGNKSACFLDINKIKLLREVIFVK